MSWILESANVWKRYVHQVPGQVRERPGDGWDEKRDEDLLRDVAERAGRLNQLKTEVQPRNSAPQHDGSS